MNIEGNIDSLSAREISGWVGDSANPNVSVIVALIDDGRPLAATVANQNRPDVVARFKDTRKGFRLDLTSIESLPDVASIHVIVAGSSSVWKEVSLKSTALNLAHARWRGDEIPAGLTWGMMMEGHAFFSVVAKYLPNRNLGRLVEIGPGYGRLLRAVLQGGWKFQSYTGVEMSSARVERLTSEFGWPQTSFRQGDAAQPIYPAPVDTVICSSTAEHVYPDCDGVFGQLSAVCSSGAYLFIDFPNIAENPDFRSHAFTPGSGEWVRCYPRSELVEMCARNGLRLLDWLPYRTRAVDAPEEAPDEVNRDSVIFAGSRPVGVSRWMAVIRK